MSSYLQDVEPQDPSKLPNQPDAVSELTDRFAVVARQAEAITGSVDQACASVGHVLDDFAPNSWKLVPMLKAAEKAAEVLEEMSKQINSMLNSLYFSYIPADMDALQMDSVETPSGSLRLVDTFRAKLVDPAAAQEYFETKGLGDLFTYTIHASTLTAQARKLVEAGEELPDCVEITTGKRAKLK